MKELVKKIIHRWPWPLTLSERYDRQTKALLHKVCKPDSVCVDVGCYRGEILQSMIQAAPAAKHIAFEPVPDQFYYLKNHFGAHAIIHPFALGGENKETTFHFVASNPTYSGLRQRKYVKEEDVRLIKVQVRTMDEMISHDLPLTLIKIDVEGGEYDVIRGGSIIIKKWHPYIIFEHGLGGSDKYGIQPSDMYQLLASELDYKVCLMGDFLKNPKTPGLSLQQFQEQYWKELNCYFLAVYNQ